MPAERHQRDEDVAAGADAAAPKRDVGEDDERRRVSFQPTEHSTIPGESFVGTKDGDLDDDDDDVLEDGVHGAGRSAAGHSCTNFVVMTDAGKPVFYHSRRSRPLPGDHREHRRRGGGGRGNDEEAKVSKMCSLLRAMCGSLQYSDLSTDPKTAENEESRGETMRCLQSDSQLLVFLSTGAVTLVAATSGRTSPAEHPRHCPAAAFLRVQLEYLYGYVLATLTDAIQVRLALDPSYDLRLDLGVSTESALGALLEEMENGPGPFLTCAIPAFFPLDASVREVASRALKAVGDVTPNTLLALLLVNSELLTLVQPGYVAVSVSDLLLLRHVVTRQERNALDRRLWIPLCLPRLHSGGYLHVYIHSLGDVTRGAADRDPCPLLLVLVGSVGSTDQFNLFRRAEASVRAQLGLPFHVSTTLAAPSDGPGIIDCRSRPDDASTVVEESREVDGTAARPALSPRRADDRRGSDEDYVDASGDGDRMIKFVVDGDVDAPPGAAASPVPGPGRDDSSWSLLSHVRSSDRGTLVDEYLRATGALHFLLRLNVPIRDPTDGRGRRGNAAPSKASALPQSIASPVRGPNFEERDGRESMWSAYQRLSLRLRIGSATIEAANDAMDKLALDNRDSGGEKDECWSMVRLLEQPPAIDGICYITEDSSTYLALNGSDFELYVPLDFPAVTLCGCGVSALFGLIGAARFFRYLTFPRSVPVRQAATIGGRLARRIILEQQTLFVANPLLWNDDG
jgi:Second Longin domain of FUZ, MON1 and HPS1